MKKVILITNYFPYAEAEPFLETEIKYYQDIDLTIMPLFVSDKMRKVDSSIKIDNFLVSNIHRDLKHGLYYLLKSSISSIFYKELLSHTPWNYQKIKRFFRSMIKYQNAYDSFDSYFKDKEDVNNMVIYTYWNTEITYALQSLKEKYNYRLISRIHGADMYKERQTFHYMPLKRLLTKNIDKIYTITPSANEYLQDVYGFDLVILETSRLGVNDNKIVSVPSVQNHLHIVSCSGMVEVKKVDKMIKALSILAKNNLTMSYTWTHIGNGTLYDTLLNLANEKLGSLQNIKFVFKGYMENHEVYEFYKKYQVDVFINVSESEGVPVSIMEAMSCHIPIVAPEVGGISDMIIDGENGYLLSSKCEIGEIVNALKNEEFHKSKKVRDRAYKVFLEKYNAKKNYEEFVEKITKKDTYDS